MPISFLHPWLWLGALLLGIPLWLHLRRKRPTNLWRFSAVRFLEDQPEPKKSPLRLRDLLLLALRALALLLVVAAFAWPFVRGINTVPIEESRVYILDNTLSHQADGGFARDRERLLTELSRARSDSQVAVVELTSAPRVVSGFGDSRTTAIEAIRALQPSFERGSYLAAFRQAGALLANSLGRQKRILFLGDNQENQWNEGVNTPPFLRDVQLELPKTPAAVLPNISLAEARAQRIFLGDRSLVNFTVKLSHSGPAATARVTLRANDQVVLNDSVPLADQPSTILLQAKWESDPASAIRGDVSAWAEPDALDGDNRVYFSLPRVVEGTVALLTQSPYLQVALSREIMQGAWNTRILDASALAREVAEGNDADVLCIESAYLQSGDTRKLLHRYLSNGHGVLLLVNRSTPAVDGCLRELGFDVEGTVRPEDQSEKFQFVTSNHPIFHPFLSAGYGNLMEVLVHEYTRLRSPDAVPLVFSERGAGLFFQCPRTEGKLFVCAFGLDREHSSWPIHQSFIPFLDLTLQAARGQDPLPPTFEPGELAPLRLPPSVFGKELVLRSENAELARTSVENGRAGIRMPKKPGIYSLSISSPVASATPVAGDPQPAAAPDASDPSLVEYLLCVNPSPKESELAFRDPGETLKLWRIETPARSPSKEPQTGSGGVRLAGVLQQWFWWWMVTAGLLALLLESFWVAAKGKRA